MSDADSDGALPRVVADIARRAEAAREHVRLVDRLQADAAAAVEPPSHLFGNPGHDHPWKPSVR